MRRVVQAPVRIRLQLAFGLGAALQRQQPAISDLKPGLVDLAVELQLWCADQQAGS
jgi:hypothetical protein